MNKFNLRAFFPQNYLIRKPLIGAVILFLSGLGFVIVYRPLRTHPSPGFDYTTSMAIYLVFASTFAYIAIHLIKKLTYFKDKKTWTILKEVAAFYLIIQAMGIGVYLCGFLLDNVSGGNRWTFSIFFDSILRTFLIEIFPFGISSILGHFQFLKVATQELNSSNTKASEKGKFITINSSLKKESLNFYEDEFLYAASDANYVVFHIYREGEIKKITIRNSISKIEKQLSENTTFFRTHRAFIVNLNQVHKKRGNALGYQLSLKNSDHKVPVSRQNVKAFDNLLSI